MECSLVRTQRIPLTDLKFAMEDQTAIRANLHNLRMKENAQIGNCIFSMLCHMGFGLNSDRKIATV